MPKVMQSLVTILLLGVVAVLGNANENKTLPKPFGLGHGPVYIGGRDTDEAGTLLSLDIYNQYINFRRLSQKSLQQDEQYYSRWTARDECVGGCPQYSNCKEGICVCNPADSVVQIYGRCFGNKTANFIGDHEKYRKPIPPPPPEWCFCEQRNGGKAVCREHRSKVECQIPSYPNNFDHNSQMCRRADHNYCLSKDINMFCSDQVLFDPTDQIEKNVCQCRKDMKFDTKNMECRIFLDVDCTYETAYEGGVPEGLKKVLKGGEPTEEYTEADVQKAFCNILESLSTESALGFPPVSSWLSSVSSWLSSVSSWLSSISSWLSY
jgi:hypothetical protein